MNFNHNDLATLTTHGIPAASIDAIDGTTYEQHSWNYADLTKKFGADGAKTLMTAIHYAYNKDDDHPAHHRWHGRPRRATSTRR